jgi:acyl-CoA reductase-like NAD-dependent aldehyde dehydrogenase
MPLRRKQHCTKPLHKMSSGCTIKTMPLKTQRESQARSISLGQAREAQQIWARTKLGGRLALLRRARYRIAATAEEIAQTVPCDKPGALHRNVADTLVAEVLPLVEACRFLEREAAWILAPQRLSTHSRPFWLRRVTAETRRDPLGVVFIIAPANYPLFLPGVQALQALAAGNAVLWKPAPGGTAAAEALRDVLLGCGLDPALLQLLDESALAAIDAMAAGVDKVFLTGSAATGTAVLHELATHLTPAVMELSGCDAVFVLPGAALDRAVAALAFGLRLNGSATCMAPRRLFLVGDHPGLVPALLDQCKNLPPVVLPARTQFALADLLLDARRLGGSILKDESDAGLRYALVTRATPEMRIAQADIFAPVLCIIQVPDAGAAIAAHATCPYALTAAIFGPEPEARQLASKLPVGTVLINDLIVGTADPRVSFGGRKASGFGVTRGREGLLEMTTLKTIVTQRSRDRRAYRPTTPAHQPFFAGYIQAVHGGRWRTRMQGLRRFLRAAARLD